MKIPGRHATAPGKMAAPAPNIFKTALPRPAPKMPRFWLFATRSLLPAPPHPKSFLSAPPAVPPQRNKRLPRASLENTIKDGSSAALYTAYTVDTVDTVCHCLYYYSAFKKSCMYACIYCKGRLRCFFMGWCISEQNVRWLHGVGGLDRWIPLWLLRLVQHLRC